MIQLFRKLFHKEENWIGEKMFLIAGLGNPGKEYEKTRHNVGFQVIDRLAEKYQINVSEKNHKAILGKGYIEGYKVILAKPQTYMNKSGESIRAICDYYKLDPETDVIIISDDISLAPGRIRIRKKGSAGGHNGLKNIILHCDTQNFSRIKVGVGEKPQGYDLADYVMGHFSKEDQMQMEEAYQKAIGAITLMVQDETDQAMNRFN